MSNLRCSGLELVGVDRKSVATHASSHKKNTMKRLALAAILLVPSFSQAEGLAPAIRSCRSYSSAGDFVTQCSAAC